jgi:hypothetical protein
MLVSNLANTCSAARKTDGQSNTLVGLTSCLEAATVSAAALLLLFNLDRF